MKTYLKLLTCAILAQIELVDQILAKEFTKSVLAIKNGGREEAKKAIRLARLVADSERKEVTNLFLF